MHFDHPIDEVFALVSDPWRFADWVVGAKCIRAVDATWPTAGSRFHHRFGIGPFAVDDSTVLEEIEPPHHLVLRARARPTGVARVRLELRATADGGTDVEMEEYATAGLGRRVRNPLLDAVVVARNRRCLHRIDALLAEERSPA